MTRHLELKKQAEDAINELFRDRSVHREQTCEDLCELKDQIQELIDTINE